MSFLDELFQRMGSLSRKKKQEVFFNLMKPSPDDILLDVGGNLGVGFEEIRKYFKNKKNFLILKSMRHSDLV